MRTKEMIKVTLSIAALLFAAQAQAVLIDATGDPLDGTDVGDIDDFIASTGVLSGEQEEVDFVNGELGTSFVKSDLSKEENVEWYGTDAGADVIAFMLQTGPGYYLVKNSQATVLFLNNLDLDWGVIDFSGLGLFPNEYEPSVRISHVSEFGEGTTTVPEPGSLALLGIAALGLGLVRRRKA